MNFSSGSAPEPPPILQPWLRILRPTRRMRSLVFQGVRSKQLGERLTGGTMLPQFPMALMYSVTVTKR